jgi:GNAT superfamily N-acetyltransferase
MSEHFITAHRGWIKGALGWVIGEHGRWYEENWRFGAAFEAKVAEAMGEWMSRYDPERDLFLLALDDHGILGSISLDGSGPHAAEEGARIRFFIMADRARGRGAGRFLMTHMMDFVAERFDRCFLTTFRGLDAARKLYEEFGFTLTSEAMDSTWGTPVMEQRFDWRRPTH